MPRYSSSRPGSYRHASSLRRIAPFGITLLAVVGAFIIYLRFQPSLAFHSNQSNEPAAIHPAQQTNGETLGPGETPWLQHRDPQTMELEYRFRADFYDPQPDGTVNVKHPVVEFFLKDGQILHIEGRDGLVRTTPGADRGLVSGAPADPPRYGTLQKVVLQLYSSQQAQILNPDAPTMTATMENAQFDNDTDSIFTKEYTDDSGQTVHAEDVPVTLHSKDYDFLGSGMVLDWNDLDHRLKKLTIAHGKKLTINNVGAFSGMSTATPPAPAAPAVPVAPANPNPAPPPPAQVVVQPADPTPVTPSPPPAPANAGTRYLATFFTNVRAFQAGKELAHGDELHVDFAPKDSDSTAPPAQAASASIAPAPDTSAPIPTPTTVPSVVDSAVPPPVPSQQPIEVYWDGQMQMIPVDPATAKEPLATGQSIVTLIGTPAELHQQPDQNQQSTDTTGSAVVYRTADSSTEFDGSEQYPLLLTQTRADGSQSDVRSPKVTFSRLQKLAVLDGPGVAHLPDPNDPKSILTAKWGTSCLVHFFPDEGGQMRVSEADLSGDVTIDHPRLTLSSDDLALTFNPNASSDVREIVATGNANCVVRDDPQHSRGISGQRIDLITAPGPDGKLQPRQIIADGSAQAIDDQQHLSGEHLQFWLRPAAKTDATNANANGSSMGDVDLEKLIATDSVSLVGNNNSSASGDSLQDVRDDSGHSDITLKGHPAIVNGKDSSIEGPEIRVSSADQTSSIPGAGSLSSIHQASPTDPKPRPINLHWTQGADLDARANLINLLGDVRADSKDENGTLYQAQSDRMKIDLSNAPTTQPTTRASDQFAGEFDFMQGKQIQTIHLLDNAILQSTLKDVDGNTLQFMQLSSALMDFDAIAHRLTAPQKGKMHLEQHRGATDQPADASAMGGTGTTSLAWGDHFVYDQSKSSADFFGNVTVVHQDDGPNPRPISLESDKVHVDLTPSGTGKGNGSATQPSTQIQRVTASGSVRVISAPKIIYCDSVTYDPINHLLICNNGELTDDQQFREGATFDQLQLDTLTNTLKKTINLGASGRQ